MSNFINALQNPEKFAKAILWRSEELICNIRNREKKICGGVEFPDKKFYIAGFDCGWNGLAWIILHIIEHIEYAENKNYIPIIDLQNFKNQYISDENISKENLWGFWFEQTAEYNPQSILKSKNIIRSKNMPFPDKKNKIEYSDLNNKEKIAKLRAVFQKYIKMNSETKKQISEIQEKICGNRKVLGIMCRGTDFSTLAPSEHPIQPNPQEIIEEAENIMAKYNCSHIFLSTEDTDIYNLFHQKFGSALLSIPQKRFSKTDISKEKSLSDLSDAENRKNIAFSYLASMYILSKCPCFISGITGGSLLVKIMSNGFEYEHFWDLGLYPQKNEPLSEIWQSFYLELTGKKLRK